MPNTAQTPNTYRIYTVLVPPSDELYDNLTQGEQFSFAEMDYQSYLEGLFRIGLAAFCVLGYAAAFKHTERTPGTYELNTAENLLREIPTGNGRYAQKGIPAHFIFDIEPEKSLQDHYFTLEKRRYQLKLELQKNSHQPSIQDELHLTEKKLNVLEDCIQSGNPRRGITLAEPMYIVHKDDPSILSQGITSSKKVAAFHSATDARRYATMSSNNGHEPKPIAFFFQRKQAQILTSIKKLRTYSSEMRTKYNDTLVQIANKIVSILNVHFLNLAHHADVRAQKLIKYSSNKNQAHLFAPKKDKALIAPTQSHTTSCTTEQSHPLLFSLVF